MIWGAGISCPDKVKYCAGPCTLQEMSVFYVFLMWAFRAKTNFT